MNRHPPNLRRAAACLLLIAGACLCTTPVWHGTVQASSALRARRTWEAFRREGNTRPPGGATPAAWLRIPACGIDTLVLRGTSAGNLLRAPCLDQLEELTVISAHRDKHFRRLTRLHVGDALELEEPDGRLRRYVIADTDIVNRANAEANLRAHQSDNWVALLTCYPFRFVGPAPQRFIAWARPSPEG